MKETPLLKSGLSLEVEIKGFDGLGKERRFSG